MPRSLITILILFISLSSYAYKPQLSSLVYLMNQLASEPNIESMEKTCEYYGLIQQPNEDDLIVFSDAKGETIKFKILPSSYPYIELISKNDLKKINKIIVDLGYSKEGNRYIKGTRNSKVNTVCKIVSEKNKSVHILTLTREQKLSDY